jgi:hypothetical protein
MLKTSIYGALFKNNFIGILFLLKKIKIGLCDHHAVCVCVFPSLINYWMPTLILMKLGMYI